ncbi:MAG: rbfA [Caulobacter sp.]|nr:rbfA [Caulobacter sp.]
MSKKHAPQTRRGELAGPTQRQLRAGELIRHALVDILREEVLADPALAGVSITVSEVRMSPDLKHAVIFAEPLGAGVAGVAGEDLPPERQPAAVVKALNKSSKFLRGRLGKTIDMKFTPDLKFFHDESFEAARQIDRLFDDPRVQADLQAPRTLADLEANGGLGDED